MKIKIEKIRVYKTAVRVAKIHLTAVLLSVILNKSGGECIKDIVRRRFGGKPYDWTC